MRSIQEHAISHSWSPQLLWILQFRARNEPLLPNLKTLELGCIPGDCLPFIPLFLSPRTTTIDLAFSRFNLCEFSTASMITALPTLSPSLRVIRMVGLPTDEIITAAVSELVLNTNQNTLRDFHVPSSLTEEACEVIYKHPHLRSFRTTIFEPTIPTMVLPNLTHLEIEDEHSPKWLEAFCGASLGNLISIKIAETGEMIDNFLEAFARVSLTTSIPATLSIFMLSARLSWRPNYRSLLPFSHMTDLIIEGCCDPICSSTIDDETITDLARAMPKLELLQLGDFPCETPGGLTVKGLTALAYYCPHLHDLTIHFQVASLSPPATPDRYSNNQPTIVPLHASPLTYLHAGNIRLPEEPALQLGTAFTLLSIFPHIETIDDLDGGWAEFANALENSRQLIRGLSGKRLFALPRSITTNSCSARGYASG